MRYLVVRRPNDLDLKKLCFRKYKNLWDIRYREHPDERSKTIYLQTPQMKLSLIEEDHRNYYLVFKIGRRDSGFWDLLASLDVATVEDQCEDPEEWGYKPSTPISFIETHMIPTLKMSTTNYEHSFHLSVPKTDDVAIYDQDEVLTDLSLLKPGYRISLLMLLDGVEHRHNYFSLRFVLEQAKARIPTEVWKEEVAQAQEESDDEVAPPKREQSDELPKGACLIEDSEDGDNVSTYPTDVTKISNKPRRELYESDEEQERVVEPEPEES